MKLSTSPDTLLRLIRATPDTPVTTPRILGGDDFAFRRRRTSGTLLLDLEKRIPIDLLADPEAATLAKCLQAHPGVEIMSREFRADEQFRTRSCTHGSLAYRHAASARREKSQQYQQERVQRYHQIHDLCAKQVDVATIARQVGLSRQGGTSIFR